MPNSFTCADCRETKPIATSGGNGYGTMDNGDNVCYACCGKRDRASMIDSGKATLYLTLVNPPQILHSRYWNCKVTNWPNSLSFVATVRKGRHNIAGTRYDVWFTGPDGQSWYGVTYGDNTQLCHCRRIKG